GSGVGISAAATPAVELLPVHRIVDDADLGPRTGNAGQYNRPGRYSMHEVRGAVDRVDHPGKAAVTGAWRMFFPDDAVVGQFARQRVADEELDRLVGFGHKVLVALDLDTQRIET